MLPHTETCRGTSHGRLRVAERKQATVPSLPNGTEPDGLSLSKLYRAPALWDEQRQALVAS
jgi:hypothetical protein